MVLVLMQGTSECMCGMGQHGTKGEQTLMERLLVISLAIQCHSLVMVLSWQLGHL
jgi:hypothetical protein